MGNTAGSDMRFLYNKVEASRNFANKIWNASRFILMHMPQDEIDWQMSVELTAVDCWIISKLNTLTLEITENIDKYELGVAANKLQSFIWEEFCDWYIEMTKPRLYEESTTREAALWTLRFVLIQSLKLLHPFMPFITEEVFQTLETNEPSIMISDWPLFDEKWNFPNEVESITLIKETVSKIRNIRTSMNVPPKRKTKIFVVTHELKVQSIFEESKVFFANLGYASEVIIQKNKDGIGNNTISLAIPNAMVYIPLEEMVDRDQEITRLTMEKEKLIKEIERVNINLTNKAFVENAPMKIIEEEKLKMEKYEALLLQVTESLSII